MMENQSFKSLNEAKNISFGRGKFTVEEEKDIESALRKKLGPSFISQRPVGGGMDEYFYLIIEVHSWFI